jgi:hypothetical protein
MKDVWIRWRHARYFPLCATFPTSLAILDTNALAAYAELTDFQAVDQ